MEFRNQSCCTISTSVMPWDHSFKHAYGNEPDFVDFTTLLGKVRLQYHLTDKAYLLPPNMRSIARFMNLNSWVDWGNKMLGCFGNLPKDNL